MIEETRSCLCVAWRSSKTLDGCRWCSKDPCPTYAVHCSYRSYAHPVQALQPRALRLGVSAEHQGHVAMMQGSSLALLLSALIQRHIHRVADGDAGQSMTKKF